MDRGRKCMQAQEKTAALYFKQKKRSERGRGTLGDTERGRKIIFLGTGFNRNPPLATVLPTEQ